MRKLYIHKTALANWHSLIMDAERDACIVLPEDIEHYLVTLLLRYTDKPDFVSNLLGKMYLEAHYHETLKMQSSLRDVGDQCLLFSGLFPGHSNRRRVSPHYFSQLGQVAYCQLSLLDKYNPSEIYHNLSNEFDSMVHVLRSASKPFIWQ